MGGGGGGANGGDDALGDEDVLVAGSIKKYHQNNNILIINRIRIINMKTLEETIGESGGPPLEKLLIIVTLKACLGCL